MGTKTEVKPQKREAWGRLRKLPSKRWQARFVGPDDKVYSARTEDDKPLTFLTKGDARAWLNGVHAAISRGEWLSPGEAVRRRRAAAEVAAARDVTFREYAERWLERIATEPGKGGKLRRPGTVLAYRGRVRNYLLAPLGDMKVREIDTERVRALVIKLVAMPSVLKEDARHNGIAGDAVDVLKMILRAAVIDGLLAKMPDVPTPSRKSVRHDDSQPRRTTSPPLLRSTRSTRPCRSPGGSLCCSQRGASCDAGRCWGCSGTTSSGTATGLRRSCMCGGRRTGVRASSRNRSRTVAAGPWPYLRS